MVRGGGHIVDLAPEWGTYVTVSVQVEDLQVYLKKAGELGGKTLVPPVTLPGQCSFARLAAAAAVKQSDFIGAAPDHSAR